MFGVVVGLVWIEVGGEVFFVEFIVMLGKGDLYFIGQLGDIIKELVYIVFIWVSNVKLICIFSFLIY